MFFIKIYFAGEMYIRVGRKNQILEIEFGTM